MPHMHAHGTHMKVEINRQDGSTDVLHDADFDFNFQTTYYGDTWLMPGDTITTTCTYDTLVTFGYRTDDEMCYLLATASPAGALRDLGPVGFAAHGRNACLGL
jgi:hypothetical protein